MIESQLSKELDGKGGGYGKFPGIEVAEIARQFQILSQSPHYRSVSSVLRITREQRASRIPLTEQAYLGAAMCAASLVGAALVWVVEAKSRQYMEMVSGLFGLFALVSFGWQYSKRQEIRAVKAQIREIERLAGITLQRIVDHPDFRGRELDQDELATLRAVQKSQGIKIL